jgi:PAS domain S-box-containing protein
VKRWFERLPIHRKLVASALLITAVALLVALVGLSAFDVWRYRTSAAEDATALAQVIAENTAAAVMFKEEDAARDLLRSVRVREVVRRACIFLPDGSLFVGFAATDESCPSVLNPSTGWNGVAGSALITRNGRTHGSVYVERDLSDLQGRLLLTALAGLVMFGFAASAAYMLAQRVNAVISRPITTLAEFARNFGKFEQAPPPSVRTSPDELGELVGAFADMVARVRTANEELRRSNDELLREKTEREAATERQRDSDLRFRTLADGSPVLLWVNGRDGCEFVNRAYLDFVGLATDVEVKGYDWSRYVHPEDRHPYMQAYLTAFDARGPFSAEFRFRRADGEWRWMRSEATPRVEADSFVGYVGASIDITERRRAEEALVEADRRKDTFLAVLAHELRNPLAPIRTGLELLRVAGDKPGAIARIQPVLERQVSHMVRLIDDLLDVSRITSGKILLQRQPTALGDLVQAAVDASRAGIDAAGLRLSVDIPATPVILDVDPTRFVQVISNLLHNAAKFTDRGGVVGITATVDDSTAPPILTLTVTDSGIGIPAAMVSKVFDLFAQVEGTGRAKSGLGIGLALARQLIEMHGGTIEARSAGLNQGSAFAIRIPALSWKALTEQPLPAEIQRCTGVRVLVIDDNVDAADMLAALVSALGGEARTTYDGRAGLEAAADFRPDVILLDIGMPGMDGYETCRRLRAGPVGESAYIVAVTGWGQPQDRERALSEGFDAHLTKPADPRLVEKLLIQAPRVSAKP